MAEPFEESPKRPISLGWFGFLVLVLVRPWVGPFAIGLFAVQAFHLAEHAIQTYQKYGLHAEHATGLLGAYFESDLIHFAFNALLLAGLGLLGMGIAVSGFTRIVFAIAFGTQTYHVFEHGVKLYQNLALDHEPARGILGHWFSLIPLHLWLNAICFAFAAPVLAHVWMEWRKFTVAGITRPD